MWKSAADDGEIKRESRMSCLSQEDQTEFLKKRRLKDLTKLNSEFFGFATVANVGHNCVVVRSWHWPCGDVVIFLMCLSVSFLCAFSCAFSCYASLVQARVLLWPVRQMYIHRLSTTGPQEAPIDVAHSLRTPRTENPLRVQVRFVECIKCTLKLRECELRLNMCISNLSNKFALHILVAYTSTVKHLTLFKKRRAAEDMRPKEMTESLVRGSYVETTDRILDPEFINSVM